MEGRTNHGMKTKQAHTSEPNDERLRCRDGRKDGARSCGSCGRGLETWVAALGREWLAGRIPGYRQLLGQRQLPRRLQRLGENPGPKSRGFRAGFPPIFRGAVGIRPTPRLTVLLHLHRRVEQSTRRGENRESMFFAVGFLWRIKRKGDRNLGLWGPSLSWIQICLLPTGFADQAHPFTRLEDSQKKKKKTLEDTLIFAVYICMELFGLL